MKDHVTSKLRNEDPKIEFDMQRQKYLEAKGYKIFRFWNNEVDANLEGVIDQIIQNL